MARDARDDELQESQEAQGNRAMRRMQKRQERQEAAVSERRRPTPPTVRQRTGPGEFAREVRAELRKVAWPGRDEVINSTIVVLIAVVLLVSLIFGADFAFGKFVLYLYE